MIVLKRNYSIAALLCLPLLFSMGGCSNNLLPRTQDATLSRWNSFEQAISDFDKVIPYQTTTEGLKELGYDPYTQPNIKILSYLEIVERFMANQSITLDDLDPGISLCIRSRENCLAYEATPSKIKTKRTGNVILDLLTVKRRTIKSGWSFNALVVINNNIVVYKIWGGEPIITGEKLRKNPLGPIQSLSPSTVIKIL